jgi:hypothetical protein
MPSIDGTIIAAPITTGHTDNQFPIGDINEMRGGHHSAATIQDRDAIPQLRRAEGMTCWVVDQQRVYRLVGGTDNTKWIDTTGTSQQYIHRQNVASDTWTITHNLQGYPAVTVVDSADTVGLGMLSYTSENELVMSFSAAFSGKAYLVL